MQPILPIKEIVKSTDNKLFSLNSYSEFTDTLIYKYLSQSFKVYGYVEIYKHCIDYLKSFESDEYVLNSFIIDGYNDIKDKEFSFEVNDFWYKESFPIVSNILFIFDIINKLCYLKEYLVENNFNIDVEDDEIIQILFVLNEVYVKNRIFN